MMRSLGVVVGKCGQVQVEAGLWNILELSRSFKWMRCQEIEEKCIGRP
jgi:hypothetical protein